MDWNMTLSSAMDALSHSIESLWNINRNDISSCHAIKASKDIIKYLPQLQTMLNDNSFDYLALSQQAIQLLFEGMDNQEIMRQITTKYNAEERENIEQ